jgi:5-methylthioadenosine/S-adenosylhomocysteine deaminase
MHTHASMMFLRGVGEDKELFSWLSQNIWPKEAQLTGEMIYYISRFAILEMIKTGTTFFCDMYFHCNETLRAVDEMGIRAHISELAMDFFDEEQTQLQKESLLKFISQESKSDLITKGISCHSVYTTSKELLKFAQELAQKHDTFLHIHASETKKEVVDCVDQYKLRPIELLNSLNILGEKTILAHGVHLTNNELNLIAKSNTTIAHCPISNLKLNSGQMNLQQYLNKGINVALATDGVASNNSLSMIDEMKVAALSAKNKANDTTCGKVADIFKMATENGAKAFNINAGEIKEGKLADFILVDLNNPLLIPNTNLLSNMIYSADSSCITDVFCNGKQLMKNKIIKDEEEIIRHFKKVCDFFK